MKDCYNALRGGQFRDERYFTHNSEYWLQIMAKDCNMQAIEDAGWKFRFSIAADDIPKAWNIVADEIMRDQLPHAAKVATTAMAEKMKDQNYAQAGKSITLYTSDDISPAHYMKMLTRIEERFRKEGIRGVAKARGDNIVPNSLYISYRNDRLADGGYNAARNNDTMATMFSFHGGRQDPYRHFSVPEAEGTASPRNSKLSVSATIKRELGEQNVVNCAFCDDGSIDITVPATFSRSNMARLGIDNAGTLVRRPGADYSLAIVNIPVDRQPDQLKIAPDVIKPPAQRGFISRILGR